MVTFYIEEKTFLSSSHMSEEVKYINEAFELNWIAHLGNNVEGFETEREAYSNIKSNQLLSYHQVRQRFI